VYSTVVSSTDRDLNTSNNAVYSLNKDKRWLIPEKLRTDTENLREWSSCEDDAVKVGQGWKKKGSRSKRRNNECEETERVVVIDRIATSNKIGWQNVRSVVKSMDDDKVCKKTKYMTGRRCVERTYSSPHLLQEARQDLVHLNSIDVEYTIDTPPESKAWPLHSEAHTGSYPKNRNTHGYRDPGDRSGKIPASRTGKCEQMRRDHFENGDTLTDDEEEDDLYEKSYSRKDCTYAVDFNTILTKEKTSKSKKKKQRKNDSPANKTRDILIIDRPVNIAELVDITPLQRRTRVSSVPSVIKKSSSRVTGKVKTEALRPEYLEERFKERYSEGNCTPRRIVIFNSHFDPNDVLVSIVVLDKEQQYCTVTIVLSNLDTSLEEIVRPSQDDHVLNFEFLLDACFAPSDEVIRIGPWVPSYDNWIINSPTQRLRPVKVPDVWRKVYSNLEAPSSDGYDIIGNESECPICCTFTQVIILTGCGHYSCEQCLKTYIQNELSTSLDKNISCPQYSCKQTLSVSSIITLLPDEMISRYIKGQCVLHLMSTHSIKSCPRRNCEAIAAVERLSSTDVVVECSCRAFWCFNCQEENHWPSSCRINQTYHQYANGEFKHLIEKDGSFSEVTLPYKPCPKCGRAIDKNGGCDHMVCACGHHFSWAYTVERNITFSAYDAIKNFRGWKKSLARAFLFKSKGVKVSHKLMESMKTEEWQSNFALHKSFRLLKDGYKLLEYITLAQSSSNRRALRMKFVHSFSRLLSALERDVDSKSKSKYTKQVHEIIEEFRRTKLLIQNASTLSK